MLKNIYLRNNKKCDMYIDINIDLSNNGIVVENIKTF